MTQTLLAQLRNPVLPSLIGGGSSPDYQRGGTALGKLISNVVGALFIAGFLLAFVSLILGGFNWISSGGDKTKLEKARDEITNAIVGFVVVAAAYALTKLVGQFFGIDIKSLPIPTIQPGLPSILQGVGGG
ncbi:hypothetical protein A2Z00_01220 [Candidatus Gottesmanbacteria bacterium RBG_13_45_10]|uniref:Uncharacterized protein n=1 Tax=Candidatus Gottesmanbacteria bacterium RBG_13_45_10 TaxID=1798370 RepID=A0A1F5ZFG2_9BACT|nr:MAG: hypothetical protein A2Z00_01220 [Candidatus Gottesmanbacteria bacterium RBG_13_45_10]